MMILKSICAVARRAPFTANVWLVYSAAAKIGSSKAADVSGPPNAQDHFMIGSFECIAYSVETRTLFDARATNASNERETTRATDGSTRRGAHSKGIDSSTYRL